MFPRSPTEPECNGIQKGPENKGLVDMHSIIL